MDFTASKNCTDFIDLYKKNPERVIFFIGAGLSIPLFPPWKEFLRQLIEDTDAKGKLNVDKAELLRNLEQGLKFLEIAEYCAEAIGKSEYRDLIEKNFDKEFGYGDIPEAYKILLELTCKSYITTNYDRIPEIGGQGKLSCYTNKNIAESLKGIEKGRKVVIKIHGDILDQDSIILTEEDFKSIMYNNRSVRNGLLSLFSTSTLCFVGFGLTDPHFNSILNYLNSISQGKTIMHYTLLPSSSKFEINSLEKKYSIRVIEYIPSNSTHPEVLNFIKCLREPKLPINSINNFTSISQVIDLLENEFQSMLGLTKVYFDYSEHNKILTLNYFTRASTEYEHQKEILSIFKLFKMDTNLIDRIVISTFYMTDPNIEFTKFNPLVLTLKTEFKEAKLFANNSSIGLEFWKKIEFYQPYGIGTIHFNNRVINFPFMNF